MAKLKKLTIELKTGKSIELESALESDAQSLLEFGHAVMKDHEFQPMYPEEFKLTLEDEYRFIEQYTNHPSKLALVARENGLVVGMLNLQPVANLKKLSHIVSLNAGVLKEYRNSGLGSVMMEKSIFWIKEQTKFEKIQLRVLASNTRAVHLYEKFGFEIEGRLINEYKLSETDYRDDLYMRYQIKR